MSLGGLASGLDTTTIVTQLMAIERQPLGRLDATRLRVEGRRTAIDDLAVRLRGLNAARADLNAAATFRDTQTATSSDPTKVTVRTDGVAAAGTTTVEVVALATPEQRTIRFTDRFGVDSVTINGKSPVTVAGGGRDGLIAAINARTDLGVVAAAVDGSATDFTLTATALDASISITSATNSTTQRAFTAAAGVQYRLDGSATVTTAPAGSQTFTDGARAGLVFTAVGVGTSTITVTPSTVDVPGIVKKVKAFVESYNAAVDFARTKLSEQRVKDPKLAADYAKGALRGDVGLSGTMSQMRIALGERVDGQPVERDTLAELGVSIFAPSATVGRTDVDRLSGKLVLDEAKLTAAVADDPAAVRAVFDAVGAKLDRVLDPFARSGTGVLAGRAQLADSEVARIRTRYAALEERLENRETRLRAYFTRLETSLQASQTQTGWLQGQISGLQA